MIEYTVVTNTSIYQQAIGFTNKYIDLLVYRRFWINRDAYMSLLVSERYRISIMIEVCHDLIYSSG